MPWGLDGPGTFDAAAGPPAAAHAFEKFGTGTTACAEIAVTEVSPFDTETPTVFMCQNAIQKSFFDFGVFWFQWETFLNRMLAFDPPVEKCSLARVSIRRFLQRS